MFEYAEEEINKKIREIESRISLKKEEEFECQESRKYILSYLNIKSEISSFTRTAIFKGVFGIILICMAWNFNSIILLLCGIACFPMIKVEISKIISNKKILKSDYSDILNFSNEELSIQLKSLGQKEFSASSECRVFDKKKNHYYIELDKIKRYKDIIEKVIDDLAKDPYYKADTKEEYEMLILTHQEKLKMMTDFLIESSDYSKIYFENNINEPIQYTDNSKKMLKKM